MLIRKANPNESQAIAPLILLAMEDIVYNFIGENSYDKAVSLLSDLIQEKDNQYSHENCWVVESEKEIIGAAIVYDGAELKRLRAPVAEKIKAIFNKEFNPEDETRSGEYYIDSVGISPNQQGKGIGSLLFRFLIDEYVYRKNETLGLLVDKENPAAKKLYLKLGFEVVGEMMLAGKQLEQLQIHR